VDGLVQLVPEVRDALATGRPIVALETSVVAQGLPAPANLEAARRCAAAVRAEGSVPAFVAVLGGRVVVGAGEGELSRLADPAARAAKAGARDLAALLVARRDAGTTVSATCAIAARVGIPTFATGGIGGVHRLVSETSAARDVSADLAELAANRVCVVSAGPKAILDVPATAEALESLGVPVVGWRTAALPAFYSDRSGVSLDHRVESAREAAALLRAHWGALGRPQGVLLCVAPPEPLAAEVIEAALAGALEEARARRITGAPVTPFLLAALDAATGGAARRSNVALLEENARVAGRVAAALAQAEPERE
jgi:pseudouridine-5'-phosphate glycosidase